MRFLVSGPVSSILPSALDLDHAAWTEFLFELGVLRIIRALRLFFGVEVVEVAQELVEAVVGRQHLVEIAQMVLAELTGHVAMVLEQFGKSRVLLRETFLCARQADLQQAGSKRALTGEERRPTGGAALPAVPVGEQRPFVGDTVDVGCLVAHHAAVVGADIEPTDVVAPDNQDVGFVCGLGCGVQQDKRKQAYGHARVKEIPFSLFHYSLSFH